LVSQGARKILFRGCGTVWNIESKSLDQLGEFAQGSGLQLLLNWVRLEICGKLSLFSTEKKRFFFLMAKCSKASGYFLRKCKN
jgi:hypothetical protein